MLAIRIYVGIVSGVTLLLIALSAGRTWERANSDAARAGILICLSFFLAAGLFGLAAAWRLKSPGLRRLAIIFHSILLGLYVLIVTIMPVVRFLGGDPDQPAREFGVGLFLISCVGAMYLVSVGCLARLGLLIRRRSDPNLIKGSLAARAAFALGLLPFLGAAGLGAGLAAQAPPRNPLLRSTKKPPPVERVPDFNYTFRPPSHPWVKVDPKSINPATSLMLVNKSADTYFMIVAERFGEDSGLSVDGLVSIVVGNVTSAAESFSPEPAEPQRVADIDGRMFRGDARLNGLNIRYVFWVGIHNGFGYQLITWGQVSRPHELDTFAQDLIGRFSLIDSKATAAIEGGLIEAANFGVSMDLTGTGWAAWKDVQESQPAAEFGARRGISAAMMVVPIDLGQLDPPMDALTSGLLHSAGYDYPGPDVQLLGPWSKHDAAGRRYRSSFREDSRLFDVELRVLRRKNVACLTAAWQLSETGQPTDLEGLLDRVTIGEPQGEVSSSDLRHGGVFNGIGLYYHGVSQYSQSADWFRRAIEAYPKNPVYVANAVKAMRALEQFDTALVFLEERLAEFSDNLSLRVQRARLLREVDRRTDAVAAFESAFSGGHRDPGDLTAYIALLIDAKQFERAESDLARFSDTPKHTRRLRAAVRKGQGRTQDAIDLLREGLTAEPVDIVAAEELIDLCHELDRHSEVIEACEALEKRNHRTAWTLVRRGQAEFALDRLLAAKVSLEAAVDLDPDEEVPKRLLARVSARLGQGDTSPIRRSIEAVPLPETIRATNADAPTGAGAIVELRATAIWFVPETQWRKTEYLQARVLDRSGLDSLSSFEFPFDPTAERIYVNSVEVLDASGAVVQSGAIDSYFVTDESDSDHASQRRVLHVPVGGLAPGRSVRWVITREDLNPPKEFPFTDHLFVHWLATGAMHLAVHADPALFRVRPSPGTEARRHGEWTTFSVGPRPAWKYEPFQPEVAEVVPWVRLCSESGSWEAVARDWLDRVAARLEPDPKVSELARTLTAGLTEEQEKVRAVAHHVQSDYTYKALAFGPRAFVPSPAADIVNNRFGDCKDHSLLLHLLLREAGVESRLALISARMDVDPDLPSILPFDHMVTYLPGSDRFIDLTDKNCDPFDHPAWWLSGRSALILDRAEPRLVKVPLRAAAASVSLRSVREASIEGGDLMVEETLTANGAGAGQLRSWLRGVPPKDLPSTVLRVMGGTGLQVTDATVEGVDDTSRPVVLRLRYRASGALVDAGDRGVLTIPCPWERREFGVPFHNDRANPFEFVSGLNIRSTFVLKLGTNWTCGQSLNFDRRGEYARASRTMDVAPDRLTIDTDLSVSAGRFPAHEYRPHAEFTAQILSALERDVVLTRVR
jgi:tetratricopeptide (TPR) repeat protein